MDECLLIFDCVIHLGWPSWMYVFLYISVFLSVFIYIYIYTYIPNVFVASYANYIMTNTWTYDPLNKNNNPEVFVIIAVLVF